MLFSSTANMPSVEANGPTPTDQAEKMVAALQRIAAEMKSLRETFFINALTEWRRRMGRKTNDQPPALVEAKLSRDRTEAAIYFPEPEYLMTVDIAEVDRLVATLADLRNKMKPHPGRAQEEVILETVPPRSRPVPRPSPYVTLL